MQLPGRIWPTVEAGISLGAGRPGTSAVVITMSNSGTRSSSAACWAACCSGGQLLRIAALGLLAADAEIEELGSERFHLLLHRRADVERRDDGPEPPRGGDRLQPRDAGAHHEHPCGRDRAGGRHQQREHLLDAIGGDQHGLVARHRRLRRERIHRLGARDPGHRLHREGDDALRRSRSIPSGSVSGARKPISTVPGAIAATSSADGPRDPDDGVGAVEQLGRLAQRRTRVGVVLVREAGCRARAALDHDLETGRREAPDRLGHEGDPAFAGGGLTGNGDAHVRESTGRDFRA